MGFPDLKIPSLNILKSLLTFLSQLRNAVTAGKQIPNTSLASYIFQNLKNVTPYFICITAVESADGEVQAARGTRLVTKVKIIIIIIIKLFLAGNLPENHGSKTRSL